jgi:hypothetical protein
MLANATKRAYPDRHINHGMCGPEMHSAFFFLGNFVFFADSEIRKKPIKQFQTKVQKIIPGYRVDNYQANICPFSESNYAPQRRI